MCWQMCYLPCTRVSKSIISIYISAAIAILTICYRFDTILVAAKVQLEIATASVMTESVRTVLSPLLMTNYVLGLRIIEFPAGQPRPCLSLLYILLLWSVYCSALIQTVMPYVNHYSLIYHVCIRLNIIANFISILSEVYQNQRFHNCLKQLSMLDDTLKMLGITTDYELLRARIVRIIFGWCTICVLMSYGDFLWFKNQYNLNSTTVIYITCMLNGIFFVNFIGDITIASLLGYVGLKFDQINEWLRQFLKNSEIHAAKRFREDLILHVYQCRLMKLSNSKWRIWIIMHLYLELCKISHEINKLFATQLTLKMANYFCCIALALCEIFNIFLIKNYINKGTIYCIIIFSWATSYIFRLFLINYMCERVSAKASAMGNVINSMSCFTYDVEIRENIIQLLLKITGAPLRFCGYGFFQFGFKFFYGFTKSVATVVVIIIQSHMHE